MVRAARAIAPPARRPPHLSRTYVGGQDRGFRRVWIEGPGGGRLPLARASGSGEPSWGVPGASTRRLAWAILFDATDSRTLADDWCADLAEVVAALPSGAFVLSRAGVRSWVDAPVVARA